MGAVFFTLAVGHGDLGAVPDGARGNFAVMQIGREAGDVFLGGDIASFFVAF